MPKIDLVTRDWLQETMPPLLAGNLAVLKLGPVLVLERQSGQDEKNLGTEVG